MKECRNLQGEVGRAGRRGHRNSSSAITQLRKPVEYIEKQLRGGKKARSRGALHALLERAKLITRGQRSLGNFERGWHDLLIVCSICYHPKERCWVPWLG